MLELNHACSGRDPRRRECLEDVPSKHAPSCDCLLTALAALVLSGPGYVCAGQTQDEQTSASGSRTSRQSGGDDQEHPGGFHHRRAEAGGEVTAKLLGSTKILRVPPGEKDLKNATALQPQDLQPGDRVLVRGRASADGTHHRRPGRDRDEAGRCGGEAAARPRRLAETGRGRARH